MIQKAHGRARASKVQPVKNQVSEDVRIDAQQDLISEVQYVLEAVLRDKKITRREIAARLGKSEATISRALDGDSNLTLKTIADIATALGDRFHVSSNHFERMKGLTKVEPLYPSTAGVNVAGMACAPDIFLLSAVLGPVGKGIVEFSGTGMHILRTKGSAFIEAGGDHQKYGVESCTLDDLSQGVPTEKVTAVGDVRVPHMISGGWET